MANFTTIDVRIMLERDQEQFAKDVRDVLVSKDFGIDSVRSGKVPGAFDAAFYVAVGLSIPVGVTTGYLANWLWARAAEIRTRTSMPTIVFVLGQTRIEITSEDFDKSAGIVDKIRSAIESMSEVDKQIISNDPA